jgi:predicted DNA-binding ribbon-helix-helix protein
VKSTIAKRSIVINGHKTSVRAFWNDLKKIAAAQNVTVSELIAKIDQTRQESNLSSAVRVFVLEHAMARRRLQLSTD